jgi:hypothetical protein
MQNELEDIKKSLYEKKEFSIHEAKNIVEKVFEKKLVIDPNDRFHNYFFHEIRPLVIIAEHVGDEETHITFTGNNDDIDGNIRFGDTGEIQAVELTAAIDGHQESLRMEHLEKYGRAPSLGDIPYSGNKNNRVIKEFQPKLVRSQDYDHNTLVPLVKTAIQKKIKKSKTNKKYHKSWLGVVFDDYMHPADKNDRLDPIFKNILENNPSLFETFYRIFIIGINREYIFDSYSAWHNTGS